MLETSTLLAWTALATAVAITPGPDTILVATHTARGGWRAGVLANLGIQAGGLWYAALFGFGLLALLVAAPALFMAVKIIGALYLGWLGAGLLWRAFRPPAVEAAAPSGPALLANPFLQGFITNVLNPKVALFYLAALPQFVPQSGNAALIGALLILIHYVIGGLWLCLIAASVHSARQLSWSKTLLRWIEGMIGAAFVAMAGRLALTAR
jgi:threonine/homoserine/homoserine lactone efflux protein